MDRSASLPLHFRFTSASLPLNFEIGKKGREHEDEEKKEEEQEGGREGSREGKREEIDVTELFR